MRVKLTRLSLVSKMGCGSDSVSKKACLKSNIKDVIWDNALMKHATEERSMMKEMLALG